MKKYKINNIAEIISITAVIIVIIFSIHVTSRIGLIEQRYDSLLSNTMSLVDNMTKVLTSLETDQVIRQMTSKVATLRKENEALRVQIKASERELTNVAQKEKKCQERLSRVSGKQQNMGKERDIKTTKDKAVSGNRGFLIKGGKPNK